MNIPIVVSAYDRPEALARLLASLSRAEYPNGSVKLIVSIDGGGPPEVAETAQAFTWPSGDKEVVCHESNLGLREHILFCGNLSKDYDGIILLEDDLYVSPAFYRYAEHAARHYRECEEVAGIALYSPSFNELSFLPFYPLHDGSDTYFMQLACSWGQLWLRSHWQGFLDWYDKNKIQDLSDDVTVPYGVRIWPDTSWKKYFIKYLIEKDRYFVYPRQSLTTNFGDKGKHHTGTGLFQVPLLRQESSPYTFNDFKESYVKYDAFGEILPEALSRLCPHLADKDFVVDLYGVKERDCYTGEYVLTTKRCERSLLSFCRCLLPIEYNIIDNIAGDDIFLSLTADVVEDGGSNHCLYIYKKAADLENILYFYNIAENHFASFQNRITMHVNRIGKLENRIKKLEKEIKRLTSKIAELRGILDNKQGKIDRLRGTLKETREELYLTQDSYRQALQSIDMIRNSFSYRLGNKIISPVNYMRNLSKK